ncbi:MAG: 2-oxo acid dehydrogenase subunit E2 [Chitinispirillaceae bacterium]|nr:2-oxo acid dehydrogenase subunit E2 [Chitinispirillaceae bacterium]
MAEIIRMLALSPTMEKGTIQKWRFTQGDAVKSGDILCDVETDKTTMEYETIASGALLRILIQAGTPVTVGTPIAIVGKNDEDITPLLNQLHSPAAVVEPQQPTAAAPRAISTPAAAVLSPSGHEEPAHQKSSPLARRIARQHHLSLASIQGTGPGGRIILRDVEAAYKSQSTRLKAPSPALTPMTGDTVVPLSMMRETIAARLTAAVTSIPHFYLKGTVVVDGLIATRTAYNNEHPEARLSLNAFLLKIAAEAIKKNPKINTSWNTDSIIHHGSIDIGLAVALDDGLITPVIRDCGRKSISQISDELTSLIAKARTMELKPEEYNGATFTISNLGSFGTEEFTAIINPPASAILAVGSVQRVPLLDKEENDTLTVHSIMKLTLTSDHRTIDGADAARFMRDLKRMVENPLFILM